MKKIVVINGPNLDLLGMRQPELYGTTALTELEARLRQHGETLGVAVECFQSNSEGEVIELLHRFRSDVLGIVINPGGYAHTSVAILDALLSLNVPAVEVHLTNLYRREEFRQRSLTASGCVGMVSGFGVQGYLMAITYLAVMKEG